MCVFKQCAKDRLSLRESITLLLLLLLSSVEFSASASLLDIFTHILNYTQCVNSTPAEQTHRANIEDILNFFSSPRVC